MMNLLTTKFSSMPTHLGSSPVIIVEGGKHVARIGGEFLEVGYVTSRELLKLPYGHIRAILLGRILLQHEKRLVENTHLSFTATQQSSFSFLMSLSINPYNKVRIQGQTGRTKALKSFPHLYHTTLLQVILDL